MRSALAGLLGLLVPGAGHALLGRRRAAAIFLAPLIVMLAIGLGLFIQGGPTGILAFVVTPGVLPALAVVNVALACWRIAAAADAARDTDRPLATAGLLGAAVLVLVVVPHLWAGSTIAATSDFLDSMFASGPAVTDDPNASQDDSTPPPEPWGDGVQGPSIDERDAGWSPPAPTPAPTDVPHGPMTAGTGTLPALGAAVPWTRPGASPWGSDGRFDLLLLGSDAGPNRWSRRMDVMLLVEVDVASGKVAMIGLPRNIINAPFPPGAARDAVACGCLQGLLNSLYVDATVYHPDRWPGTGAVKGIGAVRSVVSQLTGRPIDAVLVADLWGMIKVVDAMGGVDINIPAPVTDDTYPDPVWGHIHMELPAGQQHLNGREALFYARSRHQDSDYGRMQRQQTLLLAIRAQIGPATILNAPDLFNAAKGFAWTDLPRDSLPNLVELFGKAESASVKHLRVVPPTYPEWLTPAEITKIQHDIATLLGVAPPPPTPSPSPGPSPSPSDSAPPPTPSPEPSPTASTDPSASP
jgi:LCP family protein required for cell wall assembly